MRLPCAAPRRAAGKGRPEQWGSGFYRARQEGVGGRVHVLLALRVPQAEGESAPRGYTIYRPATGRNKATMSLQVCGGLR